MTKQASRTERPSCFVVFLCVLGAYRGNSCGETKRSAKKTEQHSRLKGKSEEDGKVSIAKVTLGAVRWPGTACLGHRMGKTEPNSLPSLLQPSQVSNQVGLFQIILLGSFDRQFRGYRTNDLPPPLEEV
ncbi:hypothetical protein ElyMa_004435100 [Elysia marginata]|uniref:Secreted protein n=1 Tax=Elysia marginata TaxID=1093978 RepID=A0AAV4HCY1_9GAST|nr:hypothetical protein ElyMa_004435100 [Elysia marginata]